MSKNKMGKWTVIMVLKMESGCLHLQAMSSFDGEDILRSGRRVDMVERGRSSLVWVCREIDCHRFTVSL